MATSNTPSQDSTDLPARGWTRQRQLVFLDRLAHHGNARAAASAVGLTPQTAYRLRRRDPMFARGWNAALLLARDTAGQVLAERAVDGIEERIYHRGELIDTRRRFDTRLLLAHLGRLDSIAAESPDAREDAGQFDQLLACIAGEDAPEDLLLYEDPLPPPLDELVEAAEKEAEEDVIAHWCDTEGDPDVDLEGERHDAYLADRWERVARARAEATKLWDTWNFRAHDAVDTLIDEYDEAMPLPGLPGNPFAAASGEAPDFHPGQCNLCNPAAPGAPSDAAPSGRNGTARRKC